MRPQCETGESAVKRSQTTAMDLAASYNALLKTNMSLIQQSMLFGTGAAQLPSVRHRVGYQNSADRNGNQISGVCSQMETLPDSEKRSLPALQPSEPSGAPKKKPKSRQAHQLGLFL